MSLANRRCHAPVLRDDLDLRTQCGHAAVVEVEGIPYCRTHAPEGRAIERERERRRVLDAVEALTSRLGAGRPHWPDGRPTGGVVLNGEEAGRLADELARLRRLASWMRGAMTEARLRGAGKEDEGCGAGKEDEG